MIIRTPANDRHISDHGWLKTYLLFSFADYYDPANNGFGNLLVFNDDTIAAQSGFGDHRHDNMEIVTIVLNGEISHRDSMGNSGVIRAGEVQHMSAGSGVIHAEINDSHSPVHLYQIWILPVNRDITPHYQQKDFSKLSTINELNAIASGVVQQSALHINADATIYTAHLETGRSISHVVLPGRGVFCYIQQGELQINGVLFHAGDQARINAEPILTLEALQDTQIILIDVVM